MNIKHFKDIDRIMKKKMKSLDNNDIWRYILEKCRTILMEV